MQAIKRAEKVKWLNALILSNCYQILAIYFFKWLKNVQNIIQLKLKYLVFEKITIFAKLDSHL